MNSGAVLAQTLVAHAAAARHVVVGELPRLQLHLVRHALVPERALIRGGDDLVDDRPALALEALQCARHIRRLRQAHARARWRLRRRAACPSRWRSVRCAAHRRSAPSCPPPSCDWTQAGSCARSSGWRSAHGRRGRERKLARSKRGSVRRSCCRGLARYQVAASHSTMKVLMSRAVAVVMRDEGAVLVAAEGQGQAVEHARRAVPDELVGEQRRCAAGIVLRADVGRSS